MSDLKATILNCTLKKSPKVSNTEALAQLSVEWYKVLGVEAEIVRVVDYNVPPGVSNDEGDGDQWPIILEKLIASDIIVIAMPVWFGHRSSIAQRVIERLDGTYQDRNELGQYPLYNKAAGVIITGNEDGAHSAAESTLYNLTHLGCTVPPNSDTYWVGDAGPGPSYIEANGADHPYTKRTTRWMTMNTARIARLLKDNPFQEAIPETEDELDPNLYQG